MKKRYLAGSRDDKGLDSLGCRSSNRPPAQTGKRSSEKNFALPFTYFNNK